MRIRGAVLRTMEAPRPYAESKPLDIIDIELDAPGPGEVLIKMTAAGLCDSDLSVVDGKLPCIPGSASNNPGYLPGFDVPNPTIAPPSDDGVAEISRLHELGADGTAAGRLFHHLGVSVFADHAVVNQASVVKIGADVPPQVAAPLGCAVLTGGGAAESYTPAELERRGSGAPVVIEAAGHPRAFEPAFAATAPRGRR